MSKRPNLLYRILMSQWMLDVLGERGLKGFNVRQQLEKFVDDGQINPQTTVAQLIGGKYNNNKFGKLTGKENNRKSQIAKRGGKPYEE